MVKLVIIADDFTGALDTGIQFAGKGLKTKVIVGRKYDFSFVENDLQVLVINTETRHLPPTEAYEVVYKIAKSIKEENIEYVYKKTDSTLRGCIGSELTSVLDGLGASELEFIPAFPSAKRTTVNGIHYFNSVPISEGFFGKDPFEPIKISYIPDAIKEQSNVQVNVVPIGGKIPEFISQKGKQVNVYDIQTDADLRNIAERLQECGKLKVLAGCAGFAALLPDFLPFIKINIKQPIYNKGLFVVCGSLNPITKKQIDYAEKKGFQRISLSVKQKLEENYLKTNHGKEFLKMLKQCCTGGKPVILDISDKDGLKQSENYAKANGIPIADIRVRIANRMGEFTKEWLNFNLNHTVLLTGGDTLLGFMNQINCQAITPVFEIVSGGVFSKIMLKNKELQIISKAGGFGEETVFVDIANKIGVC